MTAYRNLRLLDRIEQRASAASDEDLKAMYRTAAERAERNGEPVARAALMSVSEELHARRMPPPP